MPGVGSEGMAEVQTGSMPILLGTLDYKGSRDTERKLRGEVAPKEGLSFVVLSFVSDGMITA